MTHLVKAQHEKGTRGSGGLALLLSLLMMSIVLATSLGVFNVIVMGVKLSGTTRESQLAFYAADAGAECAMYVDFKGTTYFGTTTPPSVAECSTYKANSLAPVGTYPNGASFDMEFSNGACAYVKVLKGAQTEIQSVGKNTCASTARRVNRSINIKY